MGKPSVADTRRPGSTRLMVERPEDDDYPTPPAAIRALIANEYIPHPGAVWDPFCGAGILLAVMRETLRDVVGTTLHDYGDQFGLGIRHGMDIRGIKRPPEGARSLVSNPAYGLIKANDAALVNQILDLEMVKTCLLMDASFLEASGRYENVFSKRAPNRIYHFVDRVTMIPHRLWEGRSDPDFPAGGATAFAWFIWEPPYHPPPSQTFWIKAAPYERFDDLERYQINNRAKAQARRLL